MGFAPRSSRSRFGFAAAPPRHQWEMPCKEVTLVEAPNGFARLSSSPAFVFGASCRTT
jgi:hypothetical protein